MKDILTLQDKLCHFRQNFGGHFEKAVFLNFAPGDLRGFLYTLSIDPKQPPCKKLAFRNLVPSFDAKITRVNTKLLHQIWSSKSGKNIHRTIWYFCKPNENNPIPRITVAVVLDMIHFISQS